MVKKRTLLLIAGLVWAAAGINILRIGIVSCIETSLTLVPILLQVLIFAAFGGMFFSIVKKHKRRILGYPEERKFFWYFFNIPSYILMVCMMSLGIGLRHFAKLPTIFFSVFYTGLGSALTLAGVLFALEWILEVNRVKKEGNL